MLAGTDEPVLWAVSLAVAAAFVGLVLWWAGVPFGSARSRLEERFIWGVPWGTLVVVGGLFAVYLFVQRGWWHWHSPVVVAYTAVSMWDPVGWLFAGFSHSSPGHLRGNITTTIVFAPIVEWIWGHYPRDRSPDWASRPAVRALLLFPLGIAVIGIIAALFSWGPVIGFSVAAFALVGVALVHFPLLTIVGLVARSAVRLAWRALSDPVQISRATVRVVEPSWFGSAVQGHLVGLLLGVLVGLYLLDRLDTVPPTPGRLFVASVFVGTYLSIWSIWWILGPDEYVLFRAAGVIVVLLLGLAVAASVVNRPVRGRRIDRIAITLILVAVVGMGIVGIGLNLAVSEPPPGEPALTVEDYEVYYGENVPDGMVNIVDIDAFGLTTSVETSGVIVTSEERHVWRRTVSATELQTHGVQRFHVGGVGWSEEIVAVRQGWQPAGNAPVYAVWIGDGEEFRPAFASENRTVRAVVDDHRFALRSTPNGSFAVAVEYEGEIVTVPIPEDSESVDAHEVEIHRVENELIVVSDGTVIPIAVQETYE